MEHHVASSQGGLTNIYSQARIAYYNISGIPDSYFDGILNVSGGWSGTYNEFLAKYNQRIAVPSNFTILMNGMNDGLDYTVVLTMENVEPYSGTNLVAHLALTQSNCSYGGSIFNYVTRRLYPAASGTPVDFSANPIQTVVLEFSIDPTWVLANCEFIAFIQNNTTKEILQATKVDVLDLMPLFYNNAGCMDIHMVPVTNCSGEVAPRINLINQGATDLTAVNINYQVNEEAVNTYQWTGNLGYGESVQVDLPSAGFTLEDFNDLLIYTSNPNGNQDEETSNDTTSTIFLSAMDVIPNVYAFIKLDDNPQETTWECKNSAGEILFSGGPYQNAQEFIKDTLYLNEVGCYTFIIYDSGGDGLVGGNAGFTLRQSNFGMIYQNNDFENTEELVQFDITQTDLPEMKEISEFSVYPNPFTDQANISFYLSEPGNVDVKVYNILGKVVYTSQQSQMEAGYHKLQVNTQDFVSGVYFVNLKAGNKVYSAKISSY